MSFYYTYYSFEEFGRGYIGSRKSQLPPEKDPYLGSYRDKTFKPTEKVILGVYETHQEALEEEMKLHHFFEVDANPHFANQSRITSTGFTTFGRPPVNKGTHQGRGRKQTPEHIKKRVAHRVGKPMSEETKRRISEAKKGKTPWNKGKKSSQEAKDKLSQTRKKLFAEGKLTSPMKGVKRNLPRDESGKFCKG